MDAAITSPRSHQVSEDLGLWEPKRSLTLDAARRHTQRVKLFRYGLLGLAGLMAAGLIYQFFSDATTTPFLPDNPSEAVKIILPKYSGFTDDGLPYFLTADTATRRDDNPDIAALVNPVLEFTRNDGAESSYVEALTGTYDEVTKVLNLYQDVTLDTDDGYNCVTTQAQLQTRAKRIEGDNPISCTGSFGSVNGNSYSIEDNYSVFIFTDGMDGVIKRDPTNQDEESFGFTGDSPIDVKAQTATYRGAITDLEGDVVVKQDNGTIYSNEMQILRNKSNSETSDAIKLGEVKRITSTGNFRYETPENDVRGERGVYERQKNVITISGNVTAKQANGNTAKSDRLIYNTKTEAIRFIGDCTGTSCESFSGGRTQIVLPGSNN
ncbi:MAG: LPS export ABC transporter periplasmic protein LptC [Litorimonas sp.]